MLSNKNRAKLRSYEDRLEWEHTDPEPVPVATCDFCLCDTEQDRKNPKLCDDCKLPYGKNEIEVIEYLQEANDDLEAKIRTLEKSLEESEGKQKSIFNHSVETQIQLTNELEKAAGIIAQLLTKTEESS